MTDAPLPRIQRNLFTFMTVSWLNPLFRRGYRRPLQQEDLPELSHGDKCEANERALDAFWFRLNAYLSVPNASGPPGFGIYVFIQVLHLYFAHFLLQAASVATEICLPLMTDQIIRFVGGDTKNIIVKNLYGLAAIFVAIQLVSTILNYTAQSVNLTLVIRINAITMGAIYEKSLRLSPRTRKVFTAGYINTLMNSDVHGITDIGSDMNMCIMSPIQMMLALYYLGRLLGVTAWITGGAYFLLLCLQFVAMPMMFESMKQYQVFMDTRTRRLRELLYSIKVIKFQAAEQPFANTVRTARLNQLTVLRSFIISNFIILGLFFLQQNGLPPLNFLAYGLLNKNVTPSKVFTSIGLISALLKPTGEIGHVFGSISRFFISYTRINDMLVAEETRPGFSTKRMNVGEKDKTVAVYLKRVSFVWDGPDTQQNQAGRARPSISIGEQVRKKSSPTVTKFFGEALADVHSGKVKTARFMETTEMLTAQQDPNTDYDQDNDEDQKQQKGKRVRIMDPIGNVFGLDDITLSIPRGSLVAIVGRVGSGKSSLLEALVGSMRKISGSASVCGSVAYCAQEPWILSGTIEDNIVFGDVSVRSRLPIAVDAACLVQDLILMPMGLGTQIGERGIMLSGGQRVRVALARAIARNADVVLLDDPFSALDAQVSRRIFDHAICGILKGKTVIMVTHRLNMLPKTDLVVVMDSGRVAESGKFDDLMAKPKGKLVDMMRDWHIDTTDAALNTETIQPYSKGTDLSVLSEINNTDPVDKDAMDIILNDQHEKEVDEDRRTGIVTASTVKSFIDGAGSFNAVLCILSLLLAVAANVAINLMLTWWTRDAFGWNNTSQYLYVYTILNAAEFGIRLIQTATLFLATYYAAVKFHDNAFDGLLNASMYFFDTQPVGRILNRMTSDVEFLDHRFFIILSKLFTKCVCLLSAIICTVYVTQFALAITVILVYACALLYQYHQASFRELRRLVSIMTSPLLAHVSETLNGIPTIKAYSAQHDFIHRQQLKTDLCNTAHMVARSATIWLELRLQLISLSVTLLVIVVAGVGVLGASVVGLGLHASMQISMCINATCSLYSHLEAEFNSVERLDYYAKSIPTEGEHVMSTDPPKRDWPKTGAVTIQDLDIRYPRRPEYPAVTNINVNIRPGEKIAIVGRTGSGKSTLMMALFRIVEASKGTIVIDGVDIAKMGLRTLRSRMQIIPQEPILFSNTIRFNIDILNQYSDDALWTALGTVGLKEYVSGLQGKLDANVMESGSNLSSGQRQLICLCRALLNKPKILLMDEATASVDVDTDRRIQHAITSELSNTTVLSIAHRINTIAAFDRVMVLHEGRLVEFDAPHALLQRSGSEFSKFVDATGQANAAEIRNIAADRFSHAPPLLDLLEIKKTD